MATLEDNRLFSRADIFITPSANLDNSDEDSGDEEQFKKNVNNWTRSQLKAEAEVTVVRDSIWRR